MDYLSQTFPENDRAKGFVTFEGGIIWSPVKNLFMGATFLTLFQEELKPLRKQKMPLIFRTGGHYQFGESALITVEIQKNSNVPGLL